MHAVKKGTKKTSPLAVDILSLAGNGAFDMSGRWFGCEAQRYPCSHREECVLGSRRLDYLQCPKRRELPCGGCHERSRYSASWKDASTGELVYVICFDFILSACHLTSISTVTVM
ncbi:hypothetical protein PoB_004533600 [Plakobranchus ocellatus]|uniref:ShKT domain-containing protein n=1 Tax=Plakobranchus ocellatus TaxID=259542 RepID=A0AAV4BEI2_9GAST|nr:hypothetical protein PoB_004533600 [Plakobranchus ocellatus]